MTWVGKPIMMAAESETAEIIQRRLFEWQGLNDDAKRTIAEYSDSIIEHRQQIPNWFPIKAAAGGYGPFVFGVRMSPQEVEISDDVFVIPAGTAEAYKRSASKPPALVGTGNLFDGGDRSAECDAR